MSIQKQIYKTRAYQTIGIDCLLSVLFVTIALKQSQTKLELIALFVTLYIYCKSLLNAEKFSIILKVISILLLLVYVIGNILLSYSFFSQDIPPFILRYFHLPAWLFVCYILVHTPTWSLVRIRQKTVELTLFMGMLLLLLTSQILKLGNDLIYQTVYTLSSLHLSFKDRYAARTYGIGEVGWFYRVGTFWDEHIPKSREIVVAIPPQQAPWYKSGNLSYVRSFLYPRTLKNVKTYEDLFTGTHYILISRGEVDMEEFGWPKYHIEKRYIHKITTYNPFSNETKEYTDIDYVPTLYKDLYGIIELKSL